MAIVLRAATSYLSAEKFHKLFKKGNVARWTLGPALTIFCLVSFVLFGAAARVSAQHYQQTNLVSDVAGMAQRTDTDLVNPWGLTAGPTTPWWVADNGTGLSTLYNSAGVKQSLIVTIAKPINDPDPAKPTGVVFNAI